MTKFELRRHVLQTLHEEHVATLDLLARVAQAIRAPRTVRDAALPRFRDLLRALLNDLEDNMEDHFLFEERHLFPLLSEAGQPELADSLALEHATIRHATVPLLRHVHHALAANLAEEEWASFGRHAMALIEMKQAHMRREESEMVPLLRAVLSESRSGT